jgi:hypothetical protein
MAVVLFGFAGAISGLTTVRICGREPEVSWNMGGVVFLTTLAACLTVSHFLGWLSFSFSIRRITAAAILLVSTPPITLWVSQLVEVFYEFVCQLFKQSEFCRHHVAGGWQAILIPTFSLCLVPVTMISSALWVLTGRWENTKFTFLFLGALGIAWNSFILTSMLQDFGLPIKLHGQDFTYALTLAITGEMVFAVGFAVWVGDGPLKL